MTSKKNMTVEDIRLQYKRDTGEYPDDSTPLNPSLRKRGRATEEYIDWLEKQLLEEWK